MEKPQITFGLIVLNGEPFIRYNLRALYPFAHQIIVVEGACPGSKEVATSDGHSVDGTLKTLRDFQATEDTENKVLVVTAEDDGFPNGFWPEKTEMSQAYAKRATGNYLWQVDVDEFYKPEDMKRVIEMLEHDPGIAAVTFRTLTFWGGLDYVVDSVSLRKMIRDVHRLFSWKVGHQYVTHRPPTVVDEKGRNLRSLKWISAEEMTRAGIFMYHYPFLFPKQVGEKCSYYYNSTWGGKELSSLNWAKNSYFEMRRPFRVYYNNSEISWLECLKTEHPPQVVNMVCAVQTEKFPGIILRSNADVEYLLSTFRYRAVRRLLKCFVMAYAILFKIKLAVRRILVDTAVWPWIQRFRRLFKEFV
ncbi:MAG: glycosyltransferase family A protein [Nitrospirota bacterium]